MNILAAVSHFASLQAQNVKTDLKFFIKGQLPCLTRLYLFVVAKVKVLCVLSRVYYEKLVVKNSGSNAHSVVQCV
jgi:hypothetical protein